MNNQNGFTLVELAIVMTIIGLLIGGILKGQELMENARVTSTISQIDAYKASTTSFYDMYSAIPGDMVTASNRLANCNAASFCTNGDGNSIIGTDGISGWAIQTGNASPAVETSMFWKHMALANLISGIAPSGDPANPEWGATHPISKISGGFQALYWNGSYNAGLTGTWVRMQTPMIGASSNVGAGLNPLSPARASQIDRKIDDGKPQTGFVNGEGTGCGTGYSASLAGIYSETITRKNCVMFFYLR